MPNEQFVRAAPNQMKIIEVLNKGDCSIRELSEATNLNANSLHQSINLLRKKGIVVRREVGIYGLSGVSISFLPRSKPKPLASSLKRSLELIGEGEMSWSEAVRKMEEGGVGNRTARRHLAQLVRLRYVKKKDGLYSVVEENVQAIHPSPPLSNSPMTAPQLESLAEKESHVMPTPTPIQAGSPPAARKRLPWDEEVWPK